MTITWAAGQGAFSSLVWKVSVHAMRERHVAFSPLISHCMSQPKSTLVVVAVTVLVVTVDVVSVTVLVVDVSVSVFVEVLVSVIVVDVSVPVADVVSVLDVDVCVVDVCVVVAVLVEVSVLDVVVSVVLVVVSVVVTVLVLDVKVVLVVVGQPRPSYLQHHSFQSGVHAHSRMSYSAWQSYRGGPTYFATGAVCSEGRAGAGDTACDVTVTARACAITATGRATMMSTTVYTR